MTITMFPLQVDTAFTPLKKKAGSGPVAYELYDSAGTDKKVEPLMVNYQPFPALLYTAPDAWRFDWTVKGQGAYNALKQAQDLARASNVAPEKGLGFLSRTTMVKRGTALYDTIASFPTPFPSETTDSGPVTEFDSAGGLLLIERTGDGLPVTGVTDKVNVVVDSSTSTVETDYGWGYFNLAYIPFGKLDPADWPKFVTTDYPEFYTSASEGKAGLPRWIIRNGINDEMQDEGTRFSPWKPWNGKAYTEGSVINSAAVNGNGGVRFVGTSVDVDTISSTVFTYYVGADTEHDGDGSKANPYNSVKLALNQLALDYAAWNDTKATVAAILGNDAVKELEAWGDIRVIDTVTETATAATPAIVVNNTHPPMVYLRDYYDAPSTPPASPIELQLSGQGNLIQVESGTLILAGSLNLVGISSNNTSLVKVDGELILEDDVVIRDNVNSGDGGGVFVNTSGTFTMTGGAIQKNKAYSTGSNSTGSNSNGGNSNGGNGGGVYVNTSSAGTFEMTGGTISNNTAYGKVDLPFNPNVVPKGKGGGVFVVGAGGTFTKASTGGIITGDNAPAGLSPNKAGEGKAAYVETSGKKRNNTAGVDVMMNSATEDGWEP